MVLSNYARDVANCHLGMDISKISSLLRLCTNAKVLIQTKHIHQKGVTLGLQNNVVLCKNLINLYFSCRDFTSAKLVFETIKNPLEISLWNALMVCYTKNFMFNEALELFRRLLQYAFCPPDCYTYPNVLKACGALGRGFCGKMVHTHLVKTGLFCDVVVASSLVGAYAKCNLFEHAIQVFDEMPERDTACWNTIISCYYQSGKAEKALDLFRRMKDSGLGPNSVTLTMAISACSRLLDFESGKEIHRECVNNGFVSDEYVSSALVDMYGKCGCLDMARDVFDRMPRKNVVAWNSMIQAYVSKGDGESSIELLNGMIREGINPTQTTLTSILMACSRSSHLQQGKCVHGYVIRNVIETDIFINSSLIDLYFNCGKVKLAENVFAKTQKVVVLWNVVISGYVSVGMDFKALCMYDRMVEAGARPDAVTFTSVLPACSRLAALEKGKQIHLSILENNLETDGFVMGALLDMYAKCGDLDEACRIFYRLPNKDIISWTSMIAAYGSHGPAIKALKLFDDMQKSGTKPDAVTFTSVLPACSQLAALEKGKQIHLSILENKLETNELVMCALLDMYAKCGDVEEACRIFCQLPKKDIVSWTSMITAHGSHGSAIKALKLFDDMLRYGTKPDGVAFLAVLSACSHGGLVHEGTRYFSQMKTKYRIKPGLEHYSCLMDLLGRAARFSEAYEMLQENLEIRDDPGLLSTLFSACCLHQNYDLGEKIARFLLEKDPNDPSTYIALSNLYASVRKWDEVRKVRSKMRELGLRKNLGCSWIEMDGRLNPFLAEEKSHPQAEKANECLIILHDHMEDDDELVFS